MPRFENEDFNPNGKQREQEPDRTVPQDENYYNYSPIDFEFNSKKRRSPDDVVTDNQNINSGINPCDSSIQSYNENPQANTQQTFQSETADDFDFSSKRSSSSANNKKSKDRGQAPKKNKKKKAKKHGGKLSLRKKILIIILVLILIIIGAFAVVLARIQYDDKQDNEYVTQSELEDSALVKNILLIGVDARSDDDDETSRSDTMLLISFDMKHRCIKMVSFLRDTWVYIPSMGTEQRLNAACSSGGYNNVVDTIEYNFGVDIDGYVVTDFEMFEVLVDNLGGVEIDVTEEEAIVVTNHPSGYGTVVLESGTQR
ncbi:MAG: LCP family protein, partial [Clostridiales bacterium]|nr:LCP family protein [Clostridiales bacterium]